MDQSNKRETQLAERCGIVTRVAPKGSVRNLLGKDETAVAPYRTVEKRRTERGYAEVENKVRRRDECAAPGATAAKTMRIDEGAPTESKIESPVPQVLQRVNESYFKPD